MEVGLIGAGKMGFNLIGNFLENGIDVYCYDVNEKSRNKVKETYNIPTYDTLDEFFKHTSEERIVWTMLPAGKITNLVLDEITEYCNKGDVVIDGGNSNPKESKNHGDNFNQKGVYFFDVGTSGGTFGARHGASYMIGGNREKFLEIEEVFAKTSEKDGYIYTGKVGSGHFLKIVHNAILYGYMQTLAEGFELLEKSEYNYKLSEVAESWAKTAVVRGWLMELAAKAFSEDPYLDEFSGKTDASKSTNWVVDFAMEQKISIPVVATSLFARFKTNDETQFSGKVISALRKQVGGNPEKK